MEELMTAKELCKLLNVSKSWVCRAAKSGLIPHYRLGSLVRFSRTDVEAYIERSKMEAKAKERKVTKNRDEVHSSKAKHTTEDDPHSLEFQHTGGVCQKCRKRIDGKIQQLINGLCGSCRRKGTNR